jgi:16S rRNA (guanine(966)-N(2))-methyltransferase RsmD
MSHRVIAGTAKGTRLKMVPGTNTRPIMDRAKEALFSILGTAVIDMRVLDLFAGTGAVGIEALSRGAAWGTFLDTDKAAVRTIHENLQATHLDEFAEVHRIDAFVYLTRQEVEPYSFIYVAPPQYLGLWKRALTTIDSHIHLLEPDALVIVQIDPKEKESIVLDHLRPYDERTYGNTHLWFFEYIMPDEEEMNGRDA